MKSLRILPFLMLFLCVIYSCNKDIEIFNPPIDTELIPRSFECEDGFADIYPCKDYDLVGFVPVSTFAGVGGKGNDCWGWTDTTTRKEYAILGTTTNTAFFDITEANAPIYLGNLPTATVNSNWRDVKVYKDHAFIVSEASGHGMQVFDLTRLRTVSSIPETFTADTHFTVFGSAHNIVINEDSGYAYIVGTNRNTSPSKGGPVFINIQNPKTPTMDGFFEEGGYSHDAQVVNYSGPDTDYVGSEILIGSNEDEVVIADITDKSNPKIISTIAYQNVRYAHQGWFTENMTYFILGDELDELQLGNKTRAIVFDFSDLDDPKLHFDYLGITDAIDHNGYVNDNIYYQSNYTAGVRMIDISDIESKTFTEVGFFDTYPDNDNASFNGVWSIYPYFSSGNIIINDIEKGLFIIRKSGT